MEIYCLKYCSKREIEKSDSVIWKCFIAEANNSLDLHKIIPYRWV